MWLHSVLKKLCESGVFVREIRNSGCGTWNSSVLKGPSIVVGIEARKAVGVPTQQVPDSKLERQSEFQIDRFQLAFLYGPNPKGSQSPNSADFSSGLKRLHKNRDPTKHDFWYPPYIGLWNLEAYCKILMFMWSFGPLFQLMPGSRTQAQLVCGAPPRPYLLSGPLGYSEALMQFLFGYVIYPASG